MFFVERLFAAVIETAQCPATFGVVEKIHLDVMTVGIFLRENPGKKE